MFQAAIHPRQHRVVPILDTGDIDETGRTGPISAPPECELLAQIAAAFREMAVRP